MRNKAMLALMILLAGLLAGMHLRVPHSTQIWHLAQSAASVRSGEHMNANQPCGDVDVNAAAAEELDQLPGVGPVLAAEIIAERERNGPFHYPEDLINVKGIGEKTLEKMREMLKLPSGGSEE